MQPQGGGSALATQDQTIADGQSLPVTFAIPLPAPTLGTDKPSPQAAGQTLTITAQEPGGLGSLLRVPVLHQGSQRHGGEDRPALLERRRLPSTPASGGTYSLGVRVRTQGSTANFEAQKWMSYEVTAGTGPATGATLNAGPASPQSAGTTITLSAAGTGGSGIYEYQFYIKGPGDTVAKIAQDYSSANAFQWTPVSSGTYSLGVRVRTQGSTAGFEAQKWMSYEVAAGTGPATAATLDAGPASPQAAGAAITLSAAGTGGSGSYDTSSTSRVPATR